MKKTYTYVDNSNVFIEGQRNSAVNKGMAFNIYDAMNRSIFDFTWQLDYGKLHSLVSGGAQNIGSANLWGSPPPSDSFWQMVERKGFTVTTFDKSSAGKEKKVDVAIAYQLTKDAYTKIDKQNSIIYLVAGDKDFVPVVEDLVSEGFEVYVMFWENAAQELKSAATGFISLNSHLQNLTL